MTLPSIETALRARNLNPADVSEEVAKQIVYDAIRTDLADGVDHLRKYKHWNWDAGLLQEGFCSHCALKDHTARRQVIRLAAYHPLRAFVKDELGLYVALDNFSVTSDDGGPSARLLVEPVVRRLPAGDVPGELKTSAAQTWQTMQWVGPVPPPDLLSEEEAEQKLWDYVQAERPEGLAHLRRSAQQEGLLNAESRLMPELIELIGVPGIHGVVAKKLGRSFQFYNCHSSNPVEQQDDKKIVASVSFRMQLLGQANSEMIHC